MLSLSPSLSLVHSELVSFTCCYQASVRSKGQKRLASWPGFTPWSDELGLYVFFPSPARFHGDGRATEPLSGGTDTS